MKKNDEQSLEQQILGYKDTIANLQQQMNVQQEQVVKQIQEAVDVYVMNERDNVQTKEGDGKTSDCV